MKSHTGAGEKEDKVSLVIQSGWIIVSYIWDQHEMVFDEELSKCNREWS